MEKGAPDSRTLMSHSFKYFVRCLRIIEYIKIANNTYVQILRPYTIQILEQS